MLALVWAPTARLPIPRNHPQRLLDDAGAGWAELGRWPQYQRGAIVGDAAGRSHVKLGVYQFFLCWLAFYVIRGDGGGGDAQRSLATGITQSMRKVGTVQATCAYFLLSGSCRTMN